MNRFIGSEESRFKKGYEINKNGCYVWKRYLDRDGYGTFYFRKMGRRAHRVSYYAYVGDIEKGLVIDHICGNPSCVNPSHLRMITVRENNLDSRSPAAINARKTHCKNGHKFDRKYGGIRYCSICQTEKKKRLRKKWKEEDTICC